MRAPYRFGRSIAVASTLVVLLHSAALAGDGKPFLMKAGTGQNITAVPADALYHQTASVSITPKKSGICTVTASATVASFTFMIVTLSTIADSPGPWLQGYESPGGEYASPAMTQAFVVTKDMPVTFYMNVANSSAGPINVEMTRIWVICEAEKVPVLP